MSDPMNESPEAARARKRRNLVLAVALFAFAALIFVVTLIRLGGDIVNRAL